MLICFDLVGGPLGGKVKWMAAREAPPTYTFHGGTYRLDAEHQCYTWEPTPPARGDDVECPHATL